MLRIGAHMSMAGGVAKAVERAAVHGCEALQLFTKNASQWRGKPLDPADVRAFRRRLDETGITRQSHMRVPGNMRTRCKRALHAR